SPQAEPPPLYATRPPAPARLRYAARLGDRNGEATLDWQHDGSGYRLALAVQGADGPLLAQTSHGGFDAAGLAPERFVDQRRGRGGRAANFERETGRIRFSGPRHDHPAWPGAQDRLAWVAQLAAIASAAGGLPATVSIFVVDARGAGDLWTFIAQGAERVDTPAGPVTATRVLREPRHLHDWRVEAWLDPQRGHWPVRLRMTVPRGNALLDLALTDGPSPP
ncbi:DUF3108 domain-containing protein, partial [Ideonella sp. A 288]|uniref:DUF3108 domain-containing protein n=1 Tax=Ideonella sp. A 288 TaxID=1962181 RepID=UPI001186E192